MTINISLFNIYELIWTKDRPLIVWDLREKESVVEMDVLNNYAVLMEYMLAVGGRTPLPDQLHHEV